MATKPPFRKKSSDTKEELEEFIKRKEVQNKALKKIIDRLNNPEKTKSK
jgi:hypothetical protein